MNNAITKTLLFREIQKLDGNLFDLVGRLNELENRIDELERPIKKEEPKQCYSLFPSLEKDLQLLSWNIIDQEMLDSFTQVNELIEGEFPLKGGDSPIVLQQQFDRNLTWIPSFVQISTIWSNGLPQPEFLTYQWDIVPKFERKSKINKDPNRKGVGNLYCGKLFEPNNKQTIPISFPMYKGCDGLSIGPLATLQLTISISPVATSTLEEICIIVLHQQKNSPSESKSSCNC